MSIIKNLLHYQRKLVKHSSKQFILSGVAINIPMGHVNNIPTIQFFRWNSQKYTIKILCAIIDRVRLGIPDRCIVGYS